MTGGIQRNLSENPNAGGNEPLQAGGIRLVSPAAPADALAPSQNTDPSVSQAVSGAGVPPALHGDTFASLALATLDWYQRHEAEGWPHPTMRKDARNLLRAIDGCAKNPDSPEHQGKLFTAHAAFQISYDGTLGRLIAQYKADPKSRYNKKIRHPTKVNYNGQMRRIDHDYGHVRIAEITGRIAEEWHEGWTEDGKKVAMGHALIGMLRTLATYGVTLLDCPDCAKLKGVLGALRFEMPKPRTVALSAEQVGLIIKAANAKGYYSVALAQATQFDCTFRQKDCLGEIVPLSEKGEGIPFDAASKWMRGIKWEEIDDDLILTHVTSKRQKKVTHDLKLYPMVMEQLALMYPGFAGNRDALPATGPVIVEEVSGQPWIAHRFRRVWRNLATECGIPKNIRNMDTRSGAITEALSAGASMDDVRKTATHSHSQQTANYSRNDTEATSRVAELRAASRKGPA